MGGRVFSPRLGSLKTENIQSPIFSRFVGLRRLMTKNLLLCLIILLCRMQNGFAARYALIVGCNNGGDNVSALQYAEKDAREFAGILQKLGGFESRNVRTLLGVDSTGLTRQLGVMDSLIRTDKDPSGLFLFYYSGHADAEHFLLGNQKFSLKKIQGFIDDISSSIKVGVFDACNSGAVTTLKGGKRAEPFYLQPQQNIKGRVIIASSAATEAAQESKTLKGSIFSHHWFNALRGSADFQGNGRITINEAYLYSYRKTIETTALIAGEVQHPVFKFDILGQGDIVLTTLSKAEGGVVFDQSCEGKFLVLSDDYMDVFADFSKKPGAETFIALGQGDYRVINANGNDVGTHAFTLRDDVYRMSADKLLLNPVKTTKKKGLTVEPPTNEKETTPLSVYSWGIGARFLLVHMEGNRELRHLSGVSFKNVLYLNQRNNLFFDAHFLFPGIVAGADIGVDYLFETREKRHSVFIGAGVGAYYLDTSNTKLTRRIGAALTVHAGYCVDLSGRMQLCFMAPYTVVASPGVHHFLGLEIGCIFSGPYKDVKVLH